MSITDRWSGDNADINRLAVHLIVLPDSAHS
jgi:hypothetical protein